jgi:hypothetical protein
VLIINTLPIKPIITALSPMKRPPRINPIAAMVQPLQGQRLDPNWQQNLQTGGTFDRRKLEDMWKTPNWSSKINSENVTQSARLSIYGKPKEDE